MPRKIYQISTCAVENTYQTQANMALLTVLNNIGVKADATKSTTRR